MAPAICHVQNLRLLKFHYLVIRTITLTSYWYVKRSHRWGPSRIINAYVLQVSLDKTCWDKSWKSSKFKKWLNFSNSTVSPLPPPPPYQCRILPKFVVESLNPCKQHWFGGGGGFHWKIDFLFCLNSFVQDCSSLSLKKRY